MRQPKPRGAAVPALALAWSWQAAKILVALERTGKAKGNLPGDASPLGRLAHPP